MKDIMLGLLIEGEAHRDAIHIAVAPVYSDETLAPGQRVSLVPGTSDKVQSKTENTVGIVDPYLRNLVTPGQKFWLCLYCKTVTSLRHEWTHPAFGESRKDTSSSEAWIRHYADQLGVRYEDLMEGALAFITRGEYFNQGETLEGFTTEHQFWIEYERLTGRPVPEDSKQSFFTCSC